MPVISPTSRKTISESVDTPSPAAVVVEGAQAVNKRIRLCEGENGFDVAIEVGYVRQGEKVWVAFGESEDLKTQLCESVAGTQIVEGIESLELVEDSDGKQYVKDGVWIVEGPAQRSDVKNANGRVYKRKIWERLIESSNSPVQASIKARGMIGHIEHPKDGRTDGNQGALITTESKLRKDGVVWNKFELLDTPAGKILQEYTKKKVRWGVSSRGNGTVDDAGYVNENDFALECWDAVMRPSTLGAYPTLSASAPAAGGKKVQESNESNGGVRKGADGVVTEAEKVCSQTQALSQRLIEGLDEAARFALIGEAAAQLDEVAMLFKGGKTPAQAIAPAVLSIVQVMRAVATAPAGVEKQIDEALAALTEEQKDKRGEAFNRVIESLQTRVKDSVSEASDLKLKLDETATTLVERTKERDDLRTKLDEAEARLKRAETKLKLATGAISDLSKREVSNPVAETVEELVEHFPELAGNKAALLESESAGQAVIRATDFMTTARMAKAQPVAAPRQNAPDPARKTLPRGLVVESEGIKASSALPVQNVPGARLAGSILNGMQNPRAG